MRPEIQEQFQAEYAKQLKRHPEYAWMFGTPVEEEVQYIASFAGIIRVHRLNGSDLNEEIIKAATFMADLKTELWMEQASLLLKDENSLGSITAIESSMLDVSWHLAAEKGRSHGVTALTTWSYALHPCYESMVMRHEDRGRGHPLYHASRYLLSERIPENRGFIIGDYRDSPIVIHEKKKPRLEFVHEEVDLGKPPFSMVATTTYSFLLRPSTNLFWFQITR